MAEYKENAEEKAEASKNVYLLYSQAMAIASDKLTVIHPERLDLVLSFSKFHHDILNQKEEAEKKEKSKKKFKKMRKEFFLCSFLSLLVFG